MGFIHTTHGRIAIETRGDSSFIIHADYGMALKKVELATLRPGARFWAKDPETKERSLFTLAAMFEDRVEGRTEQFSNLRSFLPNLTVELPETEVFNADEPLAKVWNGEDAGPHPEFDRDDLDDLIDALVEVRDG